MRRLAWHALDAIVATAQRRMRREVPLFRTLRPQLLHYTYNLWDNVACLLENHRVAPANIPASYEILVVQGRARDDRARNSDRPQMRYGSQLPRPPDLKGDVRHNGLDLLRRKFVGDSEARCLARVPKQFLVTTLFHFKHDAIYLIIHLPACSLALPFLPEGENLLERSGMSMFWINWQTKLLKIRELRALCIRNMFRRTCDIVEECSERASGRNLRIELTNRSRRGITRIREF